jgi:hypothetical protein
VESIQQWANFTGDFNPLHFDVERAKAIGEDDVTVHAMLPQLFLQQGFTPSLRRIAQWGGRSKSSPLTVTRWPTMKTAFKRPVVKDRLHVLDADLDHVRGHFSLLSSHGGEATLCGVLFLSAFKPCGVSHGANRHGLPLTFKIRSHTASARLDAFRRSFPEISALWVFLSALTYSEFLNSNMPVCVTGGSATEFATVHTAYTIAVDPIFARRSLVGLHALGTITCALHPPIVSAGNCVGTSGLFRFDVACCGATVMQVEIGLLIIETERREAVN